MKVKPNIKIMVIILTSLALLSVLPSCKRNKAADPDQIGPTGHSITLSGEANPLTMYIPNDETTLLTIRAVNLDGTPAVNKEIVLEAGYHGYFEGRRYSTTRTTNTNGVVQVTYVINKGSDVRVNTTVYITATLVDEQNSGDANVNCVVPVQVVPEFQNDYIVVSGSITDQFTGKAVPEVVVSLDSGEATITDRSGLYSILVWGASTYGWYGTITPEKSGISFIPGTIDIGSESSPVYWDMPGQDFFTTSSDTFAVDFNTFSITNVAQTFQVYVYTTPNPTNNVKFLATSSSASWLEVGATISNFYSHVQSQTPRYLYIKVYANGTGVARSGIIRIIASDQPNMSTLDITVNQDL